MKKTSAQLQAELNGILEWFESDSADIDQAEEKYKAAGQIISELDARITQTENAIKKLKISLEKEA